jgi:hypothetical protein
VPRFPGRSPADPRETVAETRDAALQPVAVVGGEGLGRDLDQTRPIFPMTVTTREVIILGYLLNNAGHGH